MHNRWHSLCSKEYKKMSANYKSGFIIFLYILLLSCASPTMNKPPHHLSPLPTNFDWQGHRGCRGLMPENTIPAMLKAVELGVTTLEMDAVITKDRKVIHHCFHNEQ